MTLGLLSKGGDPEPWRIYAMTCTDEDLRLYLSIYQAIQEYEICRILQQEIDSRRHFELNQIFLS